MTFDTATLSRIQAIANAAIAQRATPQPAPLAVLVKYALRLAGVPATGVAAEYWEGWHREWWVGSDAVAR